MRGWFRTCPALRESEIGDRSEAEVTLAMAADSKENDMILPPKLDLRKAGILKSKPADSVAHASSAEIRPASDGEKQIGKADENSKISRIKIPELEALVEMFVERSEPAPVSEKAGLSMAEKGPETSELKKSEAMPISAPAESSREPKTPLAVAKPFLTVAETARVDEKEQASKKETSRIPLEIAMPTDKGGIGFFSGEPAKIPGIRPTAVPVTIKLGKPQTLSSVPVSSQVAPVSSDEKRETSRISLEAILGQEKNFEKSKHAPKTIRLKRPTEPSTVKVLQRPDIMKMVDETVAVQDPSKTSILNEAVVEPAEGQTPTKRKTIRIRQPEKRPTVGSVTMARVKPEEGVVAAVTGAVVDEPGLFFPLAVTAAILIVCVMIYVLMAQALGPNTSLTQLSYGAPDLDFAWPGKIYQ